MNISLPDCNYGTSSDLNALCSEHKDYNQFSIMHSNCKSSVKNFNSLLSLVNLLNHHISVIAISELWTNKDNEHVFNIPGYNFVAKSRMHTTGGGVGLFVSETYNFRLRDDLTDIVVENILSRLYQTISLLVVFIVNRVQTYRFSLPI